MLFCEWIKLSHLSQYTLSHLCLYVSLSVCVSVSVSLSDIFFINFPIERHLADSRVFCCKQTAIDKHNQESFWYTALKYLKHMPCGSSAFNALRNLITVSTLALTVYIPTSSIQWFPDPFGLGSIFWLCLLNDLNWDGISLQF